MKPLIILSLTIIRFLTERYMRTRSLCGNGLVAALSASADYLPVCHIGGSHD